MRLEHSKITDEMMSCMLKSVDKSTNRCIQAIRDGKAHFGNSCPYGGRLNAEELEAISEIRSIRGIEGVFRKMLIGSSAQILDDLVQVFERSASERNDEEDLQELLEYNFCGPDVELKDSHVYEAYLNAERQ